MSETKYGEPHQSECGNCGVLGQRILDLRSCLEAAEAARDSAWADGYNKAISQRLAASGSIEGNF